MADQDIHFRRGEYDEALRIRTNEELPVYTRIGDFHLAAVTQGQIADIRFQRGDYDETLRIRTEEVLPVFTRLGDAREICAAHWAIARFALEQEKLEESFPHMAEAFAIADRLNLADGIGAIGEYFGQYLVARGKVDEGIRVLQKGLDAYYKLGRPDQAAQIQGIIDQIGKDT